MHRSSNDKRVYILNIEIQMSTYLISYFSLTLIFFDNCILQKNYSFNAFFRTAVSSGKSQVTRHKTVTFTW